MTKTVAERIATLENEMSHLSDGLRDHRAESKLASEAQAGKIGDLDRKLTDFINRLTISAAVFSAVVAIILALPKIAEVLRLLK